MKDESNKVLGGLEEVLASQPSSFGALSPEPTVIILFNDWALCRMEHGTKTATSRTKRYGIPGDVFESGLVDSTGKLRRYVITTIMKMALGEVAEKHYIEEGAISKEEFVHIWKQVYPLRGFVPSQVVFFHRFVPI